MNKLSNSAIHLMVMATVAACSASDHISDIRETGGERVTVGTVQKEIRIGMSGAEVAAALGSPNIVTTDEQRRESWVYDKISTEVSYSRSSGSVIGLVVGGSAGGLGAGSASSGAAGSSQRTLTIIIKFDNENNVRDFSYHTSRF